MISRIAWGPEDQEKLMLVKIGCLWDESEKNLVQQNAFFKTNDITFKVFVGTVKKS